MLEKNGQTDAYVRPVAWRGSEMMGVSAQDNAHPPRHRGLGMAELLRSGPEDEGHPARLADYRRPDPATAPCAAKAAGLYMICTISKHKAERKGYADALMLDWQGRVAECTGANVFFIRDGVIHTPDRRLLPRRHHAAHRDRPRPPPRLRGRGAAHHAERADGFNECFITGTAAEVTPVSEIGPYRFQPGNMTKVLMEDYTRRGAAEGQGGVRALSRVPSPCHSREGGNPRTPFRGLWRRDRLLWSRRVSAA